MSAREARCAMPKNSVDQIATAGAVFVEPGKALFLWERLQPRQVLSGHLSRLKPPIKK
jgi:hypothetical protein